MLYKEIKDFYKVKPKSQKQELKYESCISYENNTGYKVYANYKSGVSYEKFISRNQNHWLKKDLNNKISK